MTGVLHSAQVPATPAAANQIKNTSRGLQPKHEPCLSQFLKTLGDLELRDVKSPEATPFGRYFMDYYNMRLINTNDIGSSVPRDRRCAG